MARRESERIAFGQLDHLVVSSSPAHKRRARGFTKGEAKLDPRHRLDHRLVDIFNGLDKMALAQDEINLVRLLYFDCGHFHRAPPTRLKSQRFSSSITPYHASSPCCSSSLALRQGVEKGSDGKNCTKAKGRGQ